MSPLLPAMPIRPVEKTLKNNECYVNLTVCGELEASLYIDWWSKMKSFMI
jgi:hypothetical protein